MFIIVFFLKGVKIMSYEKPNMNFVELRTKEAVAANCWSQDANGRVNYWIFYPNTEADKSIWIKFEVNGNCNSSDFVPLEYHGINADDTNANGITYETLLESYQSDKELKLSAGDSESFDPLS